MATRTGRIEMRVSRRDRALIERAAAIRGQALTASAIAHIVETHIVEKAREIATEDEVTVLSDRDREAFLRILDREKPTPALVTAVRRHRGRGA